MSLSISRISFSVFSFWFALGIFGYKLRIILAAATTLRPVLFCDLYVLVRLLMACPAFPLNYVSEHF